MYAVVQIAGKQYKVAPKDKIFVPSLRQKVGANVKFDKVLLIGDDKDVKIGHPTVAGMTVEATVMENGKGEKVIVFKKKKRKGYRVLRGHRQGYTKVEITNIGTKGA
jgi:large subunit ribosomal protein L21